MNAEQLELINSADTPFQKKIPRDKRIPFEPSVKNTNASYSVFGWEFQIISAIIISLNEIKDMSSVIVEGNTEDIELYFEKKEPEYIQAKAIQKTPTDKADSKKIIAALNTLINTSNVTHGKYSKLMVIVNYQNPLNLGQSDINAYWMPSMRGLFEREYKVLPSSGKKYITNYLNKAKKSLEDGGYLSTTNFFDYDRLSIATNLFSGLKSDTQRYSVLIYTLRNFITNVCKLSSTFENCVENVKNMLITQYFDLAGRPKEERKVSISKKQLVWKIIICLMHEPPEKFMNEMPIDVLEELEPYRDYFLSNQIKKIDNINKILSDFLKYSKANKQINQNELIENFVTDNWENYKELFPVENEVTEDAEFWGIKYIILSVIYGSHMINKVKDSVNIK